MAHWLVLTWKTLFCNCFCQFALIRRYMPFLYECLQLQFINTCSLKSVFWENPPKFVIWMISLIYQVRLKKDLWSKFHLGPKIEHWDRHTQEFALIHSWSMIHCVFKIHESAWFVTAKIHNPSAGMYLVLVKSKWLAVLFFRHSCWHGLQIQQTRNNVCFCLPHPCSWTW